MVVIFGTEFAQEDAPAHEGRFLAPPPARVAEGPQCGREATRQGACRKVCDRRMAGPRNERGRRHNSAAIGADNTRVAGNGASASSKEQGYGRQGELG